MLFSKLPEEIEADVFFKLPLKSIGKCRCVCKVWRNLLCSPRFVKYQLDSSIQSNNPKLMLRATMNKKRGVLYSIDYASILSSVCASTSSRTCECKEVVRMHYPFECDVQAGGFTSIHTLGSYDGLICVAHSSNPFRSNYRLCIWNPSTREYKEILPNVDVKDRVLRCGFGYDRNIDDYKFIRIFRNFEKPGYFQAQVYKMRSDSWTTIQPVPYSFSNAGTNFVSVLFNGALHWCGATTTNETNYEVIVSFDISSERFMEVGIPEETMAPIGGKRLVKMLGVIRDCLCFVVRASYRVYDVWVMQDYGVEESWNKQFTIHQETLYDDWNPRPERSLGNGDILMSNFEGFYMHDPKNQRGKELLVIFPENILQRRVVEMIQNEPRFYVESLVSLNSGTYVP